MSRGKLRVLVVEDNHLLAEAITDSLQALDYYVAACARTLEDALKVVAALNIDVAVVDIDLHGVETDSLLDALMERRIAVVLTSSPAMQRIPDKYAGFWHVQKPYSCDQLDESIRKTTMVFG